MKRLIKKAETTGYKYVVQFSAEDGVYEETFDTYEQGLEYLKEQTGFEDIDCSEDQKCNVTDNWGRSFSLYKSRIGKCEICSKTNVPLVKLHDTDSCLKCWEDLEFGVIEFKDGKFVKNPEYDFPEDEE